jgi:DNA-binding NarL/FixJ family response regulator
MKVRVLLADDHETVREGLKAVLHAQPDMEVVGEAADGQEALAAARRLRPQVVILDVSMPRMNGLVATREIRQSCPHTRILALTRHAEQGYLQRLLRAGASGYVLKQSRVMELPQAIRAVASGGTFIDPAIATDLIADLQRETPLTEPRQREMTTRETQVIKLMAWGHSNKEIAAKLELSVKTVETHKTKAMQKLGMRTRIDVVQFAVLEGWLKDV